MWSVRDRASFATLEREGLRLRSGPLWLRHLAGGADEPPRVAFAIGRRTGSAVVRNRLRRRLRALLGELQAGGEQIPPGVYLLGAGPEAAAATYQELRERMSDLMQQLRERRR